MIWDGTSPLRPEHEVAYRGRPTERVRIRAVRIESRYPVMVEHSDGLFSRHRADGKYYNDDFESVRDLIPLQQERPK